MEIVSLKGKENEIELCFSQQTEIEEAIKAIIDIKDKNSEFFKSVNVNFSYKGTEFDYFDEVRFAFEIKKVFGENASIIKKKTLSEKEIRHSLLNDETICRVCNRSVRSGEIFKSRGDALIYGDVNAGATVLANGNITVMGALRGSAHIRKNGRVFALNMQPAQIRIGKVISYNKKSENVGMAVAHAENGEIILQCL